MSAGDYTDDQLVNAVHLCGGWAPLAAVRSRLETTAGVDAGVGPRAKAATRRRLDNAVKAGLLGAEERTVGGRRQRCWTTAERLAAIAQEEALTDEQRIARAITYTTAEYERHRADRPEDEYAPTWPVALPDHPGSQWRTLWPVNTRGSAHRDFRTALDAGALVEIHGSFNHGYLPAGKVTEYEAARARAQAARQAINDRQRAARDRLKQFAAVPPPPARTKRGTSVLVHCVELTLEEAEALVALIEQGQR